MPQSKKSAKKFGIFPYGKLLGDVLESPRGNTCRLQGPTRADSGGSKKVKSEFTLRPSFSLRCFQGVCRLGL